MGIIDAQKPIHGGAQNTPEAPRLPQFGGLRILGKTMRTKNIAIKGKQYKQIRFTWKNEEKPIFESFYQLLDRHADQLTPQQIKTVRKFADAFIFGRGSELCPAFPFHDLFVKYIQIAEKFDVQPEGMCSGMVSATQRGGWDKIDTTEHHKEKCRAMTVKRNELRAGLRSELGDLYDLDQEQVEALLTVSDKQSIVDGYDSLKAANLDLLRRVDRLELALDMRKQTIERLEREIGSIWAKVGRP